jgi:hypothetical protein
MKILTYPAVTALGLASLCMSGIAGPLISPNHLEIYHLSRSASAIFVPVILCLLLLWLLLTGLLAFATRRDRFRILLWSAILFFGPWILFRNYVKLMGATVPHRLNLLVFALSLTGFVVFQWSRRPFFRTSFDRLQEFLAVLLGQLLWFNWQARSLNAPLPLHQRSQSSATITTPRIIWIVMDELSYQQVYEQRFPGMNLPAFDQLASDSTVFTHVIPAGNETQVVVPSLLTGSLTDKIRPSSDGRELTLHNPDTDTWQLFDAHQTIFNDALQAGYSTAVVGWYNPYCRLLHEVLDRCIWTYHGPLLAGISDHQSVGTNLLAPLIRLGATAANLLAPLIRLAATAPTFLRVTSPGDLVEVRDVIIDFETLSSSADQLIADPSKDFLFLHMPIPHPPGIYDRRRATFSASHSSYIDNLVLADKFIAHIRQTLEQRGQWNSSAIVIMGDHSWRTKLVWVSSDKWTSEDQAASHGGQFDDRPAYIVKMPHQQTPARIDARFAAIHTRALLDGIIDGRLKTSEDLAAWVAQQPGRF